MKIESIFCFFRCFKHFLALTLILIFLPPQASADNYSGDNPNTVSFALYGNFQLIDTLPVLKTGIGGGLSWDYRFNDRFSFQLETFAITQHGKNQSDNEDYVEFFGFPVTTFKLYVLNKQYPFDPYIGIGVGLYWLNEGSVENDTGGLGLGAQVETGVDYSIADNLVLSFGGTYRSVGIVNDVGDSRASTYMTYTLFGRIGYRF